MSERFEMRKTALKNRRKDDMAWFIWDTVNDRYVVIDLTLSQAETVKKALDEATKEVNDG